MSMLLVREHLLALANSERVRELLKYALVGSFAAAVNLSATYVLYKYMWYLLASIVAFVLTFVTSFLLQKFWTFRNMSTERIHIQSSVSLAVALVNLVLNAMAMYTLVSLLGVHYLYAQSLVLTAIALESYLINRFIIFRH